MLCASRLAAAECPPGQAAASCALHDEGVAAFTAGKYDEAATKFRAAIAAGPTARSYLGYSQSVEGQGKIALAYETMLVAQKLSNDEIAAPGGQQDTAIVGRAQRIKYKLAELGAKIAYVWLRMPEGVPVRRLVSVYRAGEGDLAQPLGRWIVVAPERQVMFATLDDGQRVQLVAQVAAGSQGTVVIPVAAPAAQPQPVQPMTPPIQPIYVPPTEPVTPPQPVPNPATTVLGVDAAFISRNEDGVGIGLGFAAQFERKLHRRVAITGRGAIVWHPSTTRTTNAVESTTVSANEGVLLAGARTRSKLPLYAALEVGAIIYNRRDVFSISGGPDRDEEYAHTYPATMLGGGVRIGKVHLEVYALAVINNGDQDLPLRFYATFGVDLYRH